MMWQWLQQFMSNEDRVTMRFRFSHKVLAKLDTVRRRMGAADNGVVVGRALAVVDLFQQLRDDGFTLAVVRHPRTGEERIINFKGQI
jgi:hypothetical protein